MVEVKKLPPGVALGAGDLHRWSKQRLLGRSGVPKTKSERKLAKAREEARDPASRWLREHDPNKEGE
jgi:hypothetical protein